jgi:cytidine deaminase
MLTQKDRDELVKEAKKAATHAYAPYSKYRVGAALLTDNGEIFVGCNVENASYGLTICAERAAIFSARCAGQSQWRAIAVFAPQAPSPLPCGACRQVMSEGGNSPRVLVIANDESVQEFTFEDLFPHSFTLNDN